MAVPGSRAEPCGQGMRGRVGPALGRGRGEQAVKTQVLGGRHWEGPLLTPERPSPGWALPPPAPQVRQRTEGLGGWFWPRGGRVRVWVAVQLWAQGLGTPASAGCGRGGLHKHWLRRTGVLQREGESVKMQGAGKFGMGSSGPGRGRGGQWLPAWPASGVPGPL